MKVSVKRAAELLDVSISRIYKICESAQIGRKDEDLGGLFVLNEDEVDFIKSRKGMRGKKFDN